MVSYDTDAFELKRMMKQDAHEKAFEAQVLGQRIYEREKDKLVNVGKVALTKEYREKLDNLNIEQKILISAKTNESRIKRMVSRNECIEDLKNLARKQIVEDFKKTDEYRETLKNLIV
jgi:hypothetical protein